MAAKPTQAATANSGTTQSPELQVSDSLYQLAGDLADCAGMYKEHSNWKTALFVAIHHIVTTSKPEVRDAQCRDTKTLETVAHLASLGAFIGDYADDWSNEYAERAKAVREGGAA